MRETDPYIIIGLILIIIVACYFGIVHGFGRGRGLELEYHNSTNMTLDCVRMFYSDNWDRGYVVDLAKFCNGKDIG